MGEHQKEKMVQSYHRVRFALGVLGLAFPLSMLLGGMITNGRIEVSLSHYFHTGMRDIFVGTLFAIGVFLISYKGYPRKDKEWVTDDWIATAAGFGAFGVALFPNKVPAEGAATVSQQIVGAANSPNAHYISAFVFFFCLCAFCFLKFPQNAGKLRKRIYYSCGGVIALMSIVIGAASYILVKTTGDNFEFVVQTRIVFWAEAFGIWAFAFSWLTKGKAEQQVVEKISKLRKNRLPDT